MDYAVCRVEVFTVGYAGWRLEELVEALRRRGVEMVVDVRRFPRSKIAGFSSKELEEALAAAGIRYLWLGELGALGARGPRAGCVSGSSTFDVYVWRLFHYGPAVVRLEELKRLAASRRVALMCREADWRRCHRQYVADVLASSGFRVVHLSKGGEEAHAPRSCRHVSPPVDLVERVTRDFARLCGRGSVYLFGGALDGGPAGDVDVVVYGVGKKEELPDGYDAQFIPRPEDSLFHYFVTYWGVLICGKPHVVKFEKALRRAVEEASAKAETFLHSDDPVAVCKAAKELVFAAAAVKCGDAAYTWRRAAACVGGAPAEFKNCLKPPSVDVLKKHEKYVQKLIDIIVEKKV